MSDKRIMPGISVDYSGDGRSTRSNSMGMRPMQQRVWQFRGEQYLLLKSPPASGKSRALMFVALDKLHRQGLKQAIVVVPEKSIGASFAGTPLKQHGFFADWNVAPQWNLCNAPGTDGGKVDAVGRFLASADNVVKLAKAPDSASEKRISNEIHYDRVLVCTHATFRFAFETFGVEAFDDRLIAIDEFHHVSVSEDNRLGEFVRQLIERDRTHLIAMTGSYFRGDAAAVLMPEDERRFETVTYTYYEQLGGYQYLKKLDIGYYFYSGSYVDDLPKVLDENEKTIIHIPNVNSRESTQDKHKEVEHILETLGQWQGTDDATGFQLVKTSTGRTLRIADLVDDEPIKREKVARALRDPAGRDNRDQVDIIIALGMAKEGFDWVWCEHALTIGYRSSLTEIVQIIGRATRDAPGKTRARFTNLIAEPDAGEQTVTEAGRGERNSKKFTDADDALLAELGVEAESKKVQTYTPKQERIIAGFEDIQRFHREHGRPPQHGEDRDIFERLYAVRLDRIRAEAECLELLRPIDDDGLLSDRVREPSEEYEISSDDELLEALGVGPAAGDDITSMKHVRTAAARNSERSSPEEVAQRKPCEDFDHFRSDFEAVQADIESGRQTTQLFKFSSRSKIAKRDWFIIDGHKALVAEVGKWFTPEHGERDRRLRVIFDNGTESDLLLRSLRRALNKDDNSRRIVPPQSATDNDDSEFGPLFSDKADNADTASGTIYVARSLSDDSFIEENREVLHKIGVTGGDPKTRIAGANKDPTFLLAEAELVATYKLANINRKALEATLHKFFSKARLDVALADRFGDKVHPREWFLVPLPVVAEAVDKIKVGTIGKYRYDSVTATLQPRK